MSIVSSRLRLAICTVSVMQDVMYGTKSPMEHVRVPRLFRGGDHQDVPPFAEAIEEMLDQLTYGVKIRCDLLNDKS